MRELVDAGARRSARREEPRRAQVSVHKSWDIWPLGFYFIFGLKGVTHGPKSWPWWRLCSISIVKPLHVKRWYRIIWLYTRWGAHSLDVMRIDWMKNAWKVRWKYRKWFRWEKRRG